MPKHKYKYTGEEEVNISYVGTVKKGDTIETDEPIKHPDFEVVNDKKSSKPEEKEDKK